MKNYYIFLRSFFDIILSSETDHLNYICIYSIRHIAYMKAQCFGMPFMRKEKLSIINYVFLFTCVIFQTLQLKIFFFNIFYLRIK